MFLRISTFKIWQNLSDVIKSHFLPFFYLTKGLSCSLKKVIKELGYNGYFEEKFYYLTNNSYLLVGAVSFTKHKIESNRFERIARVERVYLIKAIKKLK